MTERPGLDLAALCADPARIAAVPTTEVPVLLALVAAEQARLAALQGALAARLAGTSNGYSGADRLLTLDEAAERLGTSKDWLRRQKTLPFRVEVSPGQVRYSAEGMTRFIARRAGK